MIKLLTAFLMTGFIYLTILYFVPKQHVLNVQQVNKVLTPSVLIRAKAYAVDPKTLVMRKGLIGCSGTFIAPGTVLTAAHCFESPTMGIWVRDYSNHSYEVKLVKIDPAHDLALLGVIAKNPHSYARLGKNVGVGETVINVGSPYFFEFLVSDGIVAHTGFKTKPYKASYLITTAMINSGSSGGGAFNEAGELIGVNTMTVGGLFGWAGISLAVDLQTIKEFLK